MGPTAEQAAQRAGGRAPTALAEVRAYLNKGAGAATADKLKAASVAHALVNAVRGAEGSMAAADAHALSAVLKDLGGAVFQQRDFPTAAQVYGAGDQLCGMGGERDGSFQGNVASCCANLGDWVSCLKACSDALGVLSDGRGGYTADRSYVAKVMRRQCKAMLKLDQYAEAEKVYLKAREQDYEAKIDPDITALMKKVRLPVDKLNAIAAAAAGVSSGSGRSGSGNRNDFGNASASARASAGDGGAESDGVMPALESSSDEGSSVAGTTSPGDDGDDDDVLEDMEDMENEDPSDEDEGVPDLVEDPDESDESVEGSDEEGSMPGLIDEDDEDADDKDSSEYDDGDEGDDEGSGDDGDDDALDTLDISTPAGFKAGFLNSSSSAAAAAPSPSPAAGESSGGDSTPPLGAASSDSESASDDEEDDNEESSDEPPSLACSDSDSDDDESSDDDVPAPKPAPRPSASSRPKKPTKPAKKSPPKNLDYDSAGSSYSDDEGTTFAVSKLTMEGRETTDIDHCKEFVRNCISSHVGKQFISASRLPDFDRFFGSHVAAPGVKPAKKKGQKGKKPQQCSNSCANCWARKMWRARFPWSQASEGGGAAGASDPVPTGMSAADRQFFNRVGGFGSGRELHVSEVSAMVHGLAYISILQCEISWRDMSLITHTKDAQFVLRQILDLSCSDPDVGLSFCNLVGELLNYICCMFRDKACDLSKARWDMGCRSSAVTKKVSAAKEESDGLPRIAFFGSIRSSLPAAPPDNEKALYVNSSAWERVGRLEREEEMVLRSMARDSQGYTDEFGMSGQEIHGQYYNRWLESMGDSALGNTRHGPSMLRILRRCMYERSKYLELEVGDIPLRTGIASVDKVSDDSVPLSQTSLKLDAVCEDRIAEAKRLMSSEDAAVEKVHERAVAMLSEGIGRVSQQPRLYLKRGKRYLELDNLAKAGQDVDHGLKVCSRLMADDSGHDINLNFPQLEGELRRLGAAIAIKRLEKATAPQKQLELCNAQLKELKGLNSIKARSSGTDPKTKSAAARTRLFAEYFEVQRREATRKLDVAESNASAGRASSSATAGPSRAYEPKPANLPTASGVSPVAANAAAEALANELKAKSEAEKFVPYKKCCVDDCGQDEREIRRKETWTEILCVAGCKAVCHKKCYRTFQGLHDKLCPSCGEEDIYGKPLFVTVANVDAKLGSRPKVPKALRSRPTKSKVAATADNDNGADEKSPSGPSPRTTTAGNGAASSSVPAKPKAIARASASAAAKPVPKELTCSVCTNKGKRKVFNGPVQYQTHIDSDKHKLNVEKAARSKPGAQASRATTASRPYPAANLPVPRNTGAFPPNGGIPLADSPSLTPGIPWNPRFRLQDAVNVVTLAIQNATAETGRESVSLMDLGGRLNMSAFSVSDAEGYFMEHFGGLRQFLRKQSRIFWVSSFGFGQPNPEVSLIGREEPDEIVRPPGMSQFSQAAGSAAQVVPSVDAPEAFPTIDEGNFAELVGGFGAAQRMQAPSTSGSVNADSTPRSFNFSSGAPAFQMPQMPRGYLPRQVLVGEGELECGVCMYSKGTHETDPCPCKAVFCEPCLRKCLAAKKPGDTQCLSCEGEFTGFRLATSS